MFIAQRMPQEMLNVPNAARIMPHAALARTWPEAGLSCTQAALRRSPSSVMTAGQAEAIG